jgi:DNA-binding CsgD family transcriptional regulator
LWRAARYGAALAAANQEMRSSADPEAAALVKARVLLRAFDPAHVLPLLLDAPQSFSTNERRLEAAMLLALACAKIGDADAARDLLRVDDVPGSLCAEWLVVRAQIAWMAGDDVNARVFIAADPGPDPVIRMRHADIRGWIAARAGRPLEQAEILHEAFRAYVSAEMPDVGVAASALRILAALNAELHVPPLNDTLHDAIERFPWTDDLRTERFQALHFLSTSEAVNGEWFSAIRCAQEAHRLAPSAAWRVMTLLDLAFVRMTCGDARSSTADLYEALDLCEKVDWQSTHDEERFTLLEAAELCADVDPLRAHGILLKARDLLGAVRPSMAARFEPRSRARLAQANGAVMRGIGQTKAAERSFREAFGVYDRAGHLWRAGMIALRIYECTGDEQWLHVARQRVAVYPKSWMAREITRCGERDADEVWRMLPRRPRQVCELLTQGYRGPDIAERLGISVHTVRVHIQAVYQAFNVNSQADLMRKRGTTAI